MDSRINLGEGFSIPRENESKFVNCWTPVTPEKPIPARSNSMPIERHESQLGRGNWQELAGLPSGFTHEVSDHSEVAQHLGRFGQLGRNGSFPERNRMINHIAGSFTQAMRNESEIWNGNCSFTDLLTMKNMAVPHAFPNRTLNRSTSMAERPSNLHSQFNGLQESNSVELLFANQTQHSSSDLLSSHQSLHQLPLYGFPIPHHPNYDPNPQPSIEAEVGSTLGDSIRFAPGTAEQANKLKQQLSETVNFPQEKGSHEDVEKQHDLVIALHDAPKENSFNEFIHNSSSAFISTPFEEPKDSCKDGDQAIYLNETPQQKPPKRRKHRPKVIKEGKPSRTPKATTTEKAESKEKTSEKRKYVRRKDQQESVIPQPDSVGETTDSMEKPEENRKYVQKNILKESATQNGDCSSQTTYPSSGPAAPSCRRALNFHNLENNTYERERNSGDQQEILNKEKETINLNTGFKVAESINKTNMMCRTKSDLQMSQQSELSAENQQSRATSNVSSSMNEFPDNNVTILNRREPGGSISDSRDNSRDTSIRMQQHTHALGSVQIAFTEKLISRSIQSTRQIMLQNTPQSVPEISPHLTEGRGAKRQYCQVEQTSNSTASPPSKLLCQDISHTHGHLYNHMSGTDWYETHKKKKLESEIQTSSNSMSPPVAAVNHSRSRISSNSVDSTASTSQRNSEILNSYLEGNYIKRRENNGSNRLAVNWYSHLIASRRDLSKQHMSGQYSCTESIEESNRSNKVQNLASLATIENCNMLPPTPPKPHPQPRNQLQHIMCNTDVSRKQEIVPYRNGMMLQEQIDILKDQQSPAKRKGRAAMQNVPATIEEVIYRMQGLTLDERSNQMKGKEQNALVLYKGDGILVPYQGFEYIKKRKPRPKVDLDPETERVWKLLMWKEGSEGLEGTDEEKQRWWEEERRVFRGRADSFIARMHLVQGDRRFSKWKGSVVDSVIGVFLTQNVSDHLSSSAFMSLAARFPLKSTRNRTCERDGTIILVDEPDDCMLNPSGTIKWHEKLFRHPFYNHTSMTLHESTEHQGNYETPWTEKTSTIEVHSHSPEEEVVSSQDSIDSSVIQSNGVRSYSGYNSEAETPANGCKHHKNPSTSSTNLLQVGSTTLFEEFYSHVSRRSLSPERSKHVYKQPEDTENRQQWQRLDRLDYSLNGSSTFDQQLNYHHSRMQIPAVPFSNYRLHTTAQSEVVESSELYGEESISSWPSSASKFSKQKDASCTSKMVVQGSATVAKTTAQQNGLAMYQETPIANPHAFLSQQKMCEQINARPYHGSQPSETNKTLQSDNKSIAEPANVADLQANMHKNYEQRASNIPELTGKVFDVEERVVLVQNVNEKVVKLNTNSLKARKKAEGQKKDAVDWDSLRKQALANCKRKERNTDTMDSLDYEAMRSCSVKEISEAIRERGMNNMLAERIQEFLNRMVREHGSIDLEWLREVPPGKAKDYLLSIRGLGLKSVECVRLLTLHHLAFPVDTNVGRIAVRLGWVPLQPLPESLQLHLLELYPVLESIQKYLWPRLCKLDQRTLYELHYQLITFGKVFCTKSRPNCNACPMRAECRHFASAFASARLALPGPEEKSIMPSTVPVTMERSPGIVIDPMPLPAPEEHSLKRGGSDIVSCVPIIEEPATPEQEHIEVIESDIEELFDEDPDEIPTIKLNMEELSVTLQHYMQANMELQEGDMSKALVALNPEAASIPTPKLKNISRLRTEHQVYELPDSHPLLKGMDKREPDDPSPYLLAIWTPGETANSIQPPNQHCQSQELNKLCNDETCFSCNSIREANLQIVRGTLLIPCRTAMRGSFPLNGTYFQVNEVFADHESSLNPLDVPRAWVWNLPRRTVYFGTSVSSIFKGLSTEGIQYCFWKGFVCVRGFDQKTRAPRPLIARLHFPASKLVKTRNQRQ